MLLTAATAAFALLLALERSPFGTGLRANRDSEQRSLFLSTAAFAYKSTCLVISAAVSGFAGGLFVTQFGFVTSTLLGLPLPRRLRRAGTGTPAATR